MSAAPTMRLFQKGLRDCMDCGKPHDCYERDDGTLRWAAADCAVYRPESWERIARRAMGWEPNDCGARDE